MHVDKKNNSGGWSGGDVERFTVGDWSVDSATRSLMRGDIRVSLEPKVMDLLSVLSSEPGRVFTRDELDRRLWPGVTVGEDTLARTISKLRRGLGDSAGSPLFIETIPKRGYRLIAHVGEVDALSLPRASHQKLRSAIPFVVGVIFLVTAGLVTWKVIRPYAPVPPAAQMTDRANDLYMQFTRADNEASIVLFERAMVADPNYAPAQAGLANALVQRVIRWQSPAGEEPYATTLGEALASGLNTQGDAPALLRRAIDLGERAVRLSPKNADALKALGFAYAASGDIERAQKYYALAVEADANMWEAMINLGEMRSLANDDTGAIAWYEKAYAAMDRAYQDEPQRIGPWRAPLGVLIGDAYGQLGNFDVAENWYRRTLDQSPFEPEATIRLAHLLRERGAFDEARRLCAALNSRVGQFAECDG